ncbi:YheC/YheD family protein [Bacillus sp. 31A1R]|uniref:YheC/YheD family protein n=1 Tax=Robertmurraya mangrovi TaxID=3098077 RepID=A0ABU5J0V4_9BACI|nr:YheC/YheD family protein [Bacillus sp. 31A1R]MDZ5472996.1 YheC/YheD family protein [Bacillus sp. 31A1R]
MSTISRGKWKQYQILKKNEKLSTYLLDTKIFSIDTLFDFLEKYQNIKITPSFGYRTFFVYSIDLDTFEILTPQEKKILEGKQACFDYLIKVLPKDQTSIIQQITPSNEVGDYINEQILTLYRPNPSSKWKIKSNLPYMNHIELGIFQRFTVKNICLEIAEQLGAYYEDTQLIVVTIGFDLSDKVWINQTELHPPSSKWTQYNMLHVNRKVRANLPDTELATPSSISNFLKKFNKVILKPCVGQWGKGVIQITTLSDGTLEYHFRKNKVTFQTFDELYEYLNKKYFTKRYLVQKKISLASVESNPFDIRVMVQKESKELPWFITGRLIKVASNNFVVTNFAKSVFPLEEGLKLSSIKEKPILKIMKKLNLVCLISSNHLLKSNPELHRLGYDMAIDEKGEIYIIEVNYVPDVAMFHLLEDKTMYKLINSTAVKYRSSEKTAKH